MSDKDDKPKKKAVEKVAATESGRKFLVYSTSDRMISLKLGAGHDDLCLSPGQRIVVNEADLPLVLPNGIKKVLTN